MIRTLWVIPALFLGLVLASLSSHAAEPAFPELTGRVVDEAGVLSQGARARLTAELAQQESKTKQQIVVATVKSLGGVTIEDYGYQLGRRWGIGQRGANNGVILLVAPNDRKVRIEVGYGLEGDLTDAVAVGIVNGVILPAFRKGDVENGVIAGTESIIRALGGNASPGVRPIEDRESQDNGLSIGSIIFTVLIFLFFVRAMRRGGGGMGSMILPFMIASSLGSRRRDGSVFGGGGFSGGGFSGGGGSFGGGGSSGSW